MKIHLLIPSLFAWLITFAMAHADTYELPSTPGDTVLTQSSEPIYYEVEQNETLLDVARRFLLGQTEIVNLNHDVDRWLVKKGQKVRLANQRILPDAPHDGIVLNLAEYRMYVYSAKHPGQVMTFAHGVGRQDWKTPLGKTSIVKKVKDPFWYPPETIRREHAADGDFLPEVVPPGPHNPLGAYALYLNLKGDYRIHGTDIDKVFGIGMQITHGCVRMYPEDIEKLYYVAEVGTPVYLVKQPIKVGWLNNTLYVEAHPDLEGEELSKDERFSLALSLIQKANNGELPEFDQRPLNEALTKLEGIPTPIYERLPPLEEAQPQAVPVENSVSAPEPRLPVAPASKPVAAAKPVVPVKSIAPKASTATTKAKPVISAKKPATSKAAQTSTKLASSKLAATKLTKTPAASKSLAKKAPTSVAKKTPTKTDVKLVLAKATTSKAKTATTSKSASSQSKRQGSPGGYYHGN